MTKSTKLRLASLLIAITAVVPATSFANATSPSDVVSKLQSYFVTDDVDSMMTLYNEHSVMAPQPGGEAVKGKEAIRPIMQGFADTAQDISLKVRTVYQTGETALLVVDWTMAYKDADGNLAEMSGTATDVVKQADDGHWYYLIDNPFGVALPQ